ncbi:unnamed protein product [Leptidea sinapis]|uniref:THAP-type domain-containing protein n=1 Tax=Leptidea sinapis TaxID=189913 RepID=A0A5E4QY16_9NEOP|nr:unnamed protein product [Leptidea sinapis]
MKCCVSSCNNDSRYEAESRGISFHSLPYESNVRSVWLEAIGNVATDNKHVVCSEHFVDDDMYYTNGGVRKLKAGAVPRVAACRICLATELKLYQLQCSDLDHTYQEITGVTYTEVLPQFVCTECAQRLINFRQFKNKCLKSHSLMQQILDKHDRLSFSSIKSIDRDTSLLKSNLSIKHNSDIYDLSLVYDDSKIIDHLKVEEDLFKDNDDLKNEDVIQDDIKIDDDILNDDLTNDADINIKSDDNFSSDDNLLINLKRKKRKKDKKHTAKKVRKKETEPKIDRRRKPFLNGDLNETLFTITDLTYEEQVAEIQKRQESANYKNAVFKCTLCFKGFLDEDAYKGHMMRHTDQCGEYECEICKTHFKHSHALRKHITAHHTQRYCCNYCPYVTTHRQLDCTRGGTKEPNISVPTFPENAPLCELCNVPREKTSEDETEDRRYPSQIRKSEGPISCEQWTLARTTRTSDGCTPTRIEQSTL